MRCESCREENPGGTKFCGHCGALLNPAPTETAELRQLTVLFCDLVGSTALSESLDPEDLRELTGSYQAVCAAAIHRHDGHIAQYLGDGVLVYFGYPAAHDDDARRAVRAALEIVADLAELTTRLRRERGITLNARLGIHTGPVVVGEVGGGERREQLAVGMTPNLAARIQGIALPGSVLVSEDTWSIVRGFFEFDSLGSHEIKGLATAVNLHRVLRESGAENRLDAERRTGLTQLTGRDEELAVLDLRWSGIRESGGHAVLVQGEAGIGKSRIVDSFREHVRRQAGPVLECFCTPYAQSTPLFPIVGLVEHVFGFTRETPADDKRAAIGLRLERRGILTQETFALIAEMLGIPPANGDPLSGYSPHKRRERTLETLREWLLAVARDGPTLWVIEDMHWVDPTTLEFVSSLIGAMSERPLLAILTSRPDFAAPWHVNGRVSSMMLSRLEPDQTRSMAVRVARGKAMPADVLSQIVARTEGIPLFVEEVTKAVLERGVLVEREDRFEISGTFPADLIPSTVQGSLNARLDRLGPAKAIAQIAATIGREFSFELLSAVAEADEAELRRGLDRLTGAELVSRLEGSPEETFLFKHALVRDAAYQSLLRKSRRRLHERIAEALTSRFADTARRKPELVAEHFSAADRADQAVKFWLLAGQLALGRAANHEAIIHVNRGLELVSSLPTAERHHQELELLMILIPALIAAKGWASPGLEEVYRRAAELVDLLGETAHRFTVMTGTMAFHLVSGRVEQSLGLAREVFELAKGTSDPLLLTVAHQCCSAAYWFRGNFRPAVEHAEAAMAMFDMDRERLIGRMLGQSACVALLCYQASCLWMLGFPDRCMQVVEYFMTIAREIGHPPSLEFALCNQALNLVVFGEAEQVLTCCDEALRVAREERLGYYEPAVTVYRGWGLSERGDPAEAADQIRRAMKSYNAGGNGIHQLIQHVILAGVQWKAGAWSDAFTTLASGMKLAKKNGEGLFEPELYRLKGEFLLARAMGAAGPLNAAEDRASLLAEAEGWVREGLDLARRQEAKMLELRSLMSLCRVRREQGPVSQEREALARVCDAFTEGFATPDLREARALRETLKA